MSKPTPKRRRSAAEPHDLTVTDGTLTIGHIKERAGVCHASTWPGTASLGAFPDRKSAAAAISAAYVALKAVG